VVVRTALTGQDLGRISTVSTPKYHAHINMTPHPRHPVTLN